MAISQVSICNAALIQIGDDTITAITDNSERARLCNHRYETIRDAVLRAHPWNFALARANLAAETATPTWEYDYQFVLPTDPYCLKVLEVRDYRMDEWVVEGRKILANDNNIYIRFISRITSEAEFDPLFAEAFAARLAHEICYKVTGSRTKEEMAWSLYQNKLKEARSMDGQEGRPMKITSTIFADARK